ncbi:MAG: hypothetical protein SFX72_10355 [Isosphaeraceae bacterium]|nr:hypothetical protein [Isosphaeraceae bacterium]
MNGVGRVRTQVTLFVEPPWGPVLDELRAVLDPVQAALISAHVTLLREDEFADVAADVILHRAGAWAAGPLVLGFGRPQRFEGHGVLLPCERGAEGFRGLRRWLLPDRDVREHAAHLTLAHPRNPRSTGNTDEAIESLPQVLELEFTTASLIEQVGREPWRIIQSVRLGRCDSGIDNGLV